MSTKHIRSLKDRNARKRARESIVKAAQSHRLTRMTTSNQLSMRNLNEAVCIVRRNRLVSNTTLALAGFNPHGGK